MADSAVQATATRLRPAPGPIRRFTAEMIDPWLLGRLEMVWPGHGKQFWNGRFLGFSMSNDYLVVCNDLAVLLAERRVHPITSVPTVWVVFAWSRDTEEGEWLEAKNAQPILDLYNHCRRWMTDMNGEAMLCGLCDDLNGATIVSLWLAARGGNGAPAVLVRPYKKVGR